MASSLNASTSGAGGIITTADNSGILNIQSGGTTVVAVTSAGAAVTGTFTVNGASVASQWTTSGSDISYSAGNVSLGANVYSGGGIKSFNITGTYPTIALYDATNTLRYSMIASAAQTEFNTSVYKFANTAGSTEYMRINANGNVGIGNNIMEDLNGAYQRLVVGSGVGNQGMTIFAGPTSYSAYLAYKSVANSSIQGLTYYDFSTNRYYCMSVTGGVYLASGGTSWTSASDERVKDIIEPITDGLNKVNSLRSVIGKYKTDEEGIRRSFLIAQDVQAVLPEAVDASNPDELGVNYTEVIPLLVAAIKELKAEIDLLKGAA